jgi:YbbR domain-containing protein
MMMKNKLKKHSLKFIAAFLSIFLWIYVLNSEKVKFEKTVQLEYILPTDMMFSQKPIQEVTFLIEGPRAFVRTVAEREDRLVIDLNRANAKKELNFSVDINPTQLNLPFGMMVERVLPRRIPIKLEKKASKIVPIKLSFAGELPDNLKIIKSEITPSEVEVYGPRSLISKVKKISSKPIEFENLIGQESYPFELQLPDERLSLQTNSNFVFNYQLKAASSNYTLKDIPIKFLTQSKNVSSKVKKADLQLHLPEEVLKNRSNLSSSVQIWADIPENSKGKVRVPLKVVLPPGILLLEISPKSIIVNIR